MENNVYEPNSSIYKYKITMKVNITEEETYDIQEINIRSVAIDSNYEEMNMPMLFATISIDRNLLDKLIKYQNTATITMEIKRCVSNSDMPELFVDHIVDEFIYFTTEDINKNSKADYYGENKDREDLYKIVTLGLLSLNHINKNKKVLNGVISGKKSSIMYYLTNHLEVVIEPPTKNDMMKDIYLPPMNSVSKSIEYLNSLSVLYDTPYRFFIDFDYAYLLSSSGKAVEKQGEDISTVFIVIRNSYDESSKIQGMITDDAQSMYQIECDAIDCEISDNHFSEKGYSKLSAIDASGNTSDSSMTTVDKSTTIIKEKTKAIRVSNDNSGIVNNMISDMDTSSIKLMIQKIDVNSEVLSVNKEYIVRADETYDTEDYNGKYILTRKRELYMREDNIFVMNTMLLLKKVPTSEYIMPNAIAR